MSHERYRTELTAALADSPDCERAPFRQKGMELGTDEPKWVISVRANAAARNIVSAVMRGLDPRIHQSRKKCFV